MKLSETKKFRLDIKNNNVVKLDSYMTINNMDSKSNKFQLPVLIQTFWYSEKPKDSIYLYTNIPLPKNFVKIYTTPYINPKNNKLTNYNHLIFGVEKDGRHCTIWLDGPAKREKLMRYEALDAIRTEDQVVLSRWLCEEHNILQIVEIRDRKSMDGWRSVRVFVLSVGQVF